MWCGLRTILEKFVDSPSKNSKWPRTSVNNIELELDAKKKFITFLGNTCMKEMRKQFFLISRLLRPRGMR